MYFIDFFLCKQNTAYDLRISDWSSEVCSSDLRSALGNIPLHQGDMFGIFHPVAIDQHAELAAPGAVDLALDDLVDQVIVAPAVGDQVSDGADLQPVQLGEADQVRQPGHGAVVIHDLADHAGRVQAGQPRDIHRGLRSEE